MSNAEGKPFEILRFDILLFCGLPGGFAGRAIEVSYKNTKKDERNNWHHATRDLPPATSNVQWTTDDGRLANNTHL
jgi:hypothetical protein